MEKHLWNLHWYKGRIEKYVGKISLHGSFLLATGPSWRKGDGNYLEILWVKRNCRNYLCKFRPPSEGSIHHWKSWHSLKAKEGTRLTTPVWLGHWLLSCKFIPLIFPHSRFSSLSLFLLFSSFLFLPPTFFLFYKEEFDSYKSSNAQHLSPGGLLFTRQHLHSARWDPLSAIDRRCCW